jgi:hypothetical protein
MHLFIALLVLFSDEDQFLGSHLGHRRRRHCGRGRLGLLVIVADEVVIDEVGAVPAAPAVPDVHGEAELEVERADLADVFILAAGGADAGAFVDALVALPLEDREGTEADPALLPVVLLEHAHVGVLPVALVAGHWEIRRLPALLVDSGSRGQPSFPLHPNSYIIVARNE